MYQVCGGGGGGSAVSLVSNLNLSCIELELGLGFDNKGWARYLDFCYIPLYICKYLEPSIRVKIFA